MKEFFDRLATAYDQLLVVPESAPRQIAQGIIRTVRASSDTRFLEVGVGTGRLAVPIASLGCPYVGVDLSHDMLTVFRSKAAQPLSHLSLVQADGTLLPFAASSFDVVLTNGVLCHIDRWQTAVREIQRVTAPGGKYLYCYDKARPNRVAVEVDTAWREILIERGVVDESGAEPVVTDAECLRLLEQEGHCHDPVVAAAWTRSADIAEYLESYEARVGPLYRTLPPAEFAEMLEKFRAWGRRAYSGGGTLSYDVEFTVQPISW